MLGGALLLISIKKCEHVLCRLFFEDVPIRRERLLNFNIEEATVVFAEEMPTNQASLIKSRRTNLQSSWWRSLVDVVWCGSK